jgi:hypothetical protein
MGTDEQGQGQQFQRRIRRRVKRDGIDVDVAADVNIAYSTGSRGGKASTATSTQSTAIVQGSRARRDGPEST